MVRALGMAPGAAANTSFADDDAIPQEWKGTIRTAVDAGLIRGLEGNTFGPDQAMTRAQACVIATRVQSFAP